MNPRAWLVEAALPSPHTTVMLDRAKAEQYAVKYSGVVIPLVALEDRRK